MVRCSSPADKLRRDWQHGADGGSFASEEKKNKFGSRQKIGKSKFVPIRNFEVIDLQGG
jgi:hypothetical protein